MSHKLFTRIMIVLVLALLFPSELQANNTGTAAINQGNYRIILSPAELFRGPDTITDNPFNTLPGQDRLFGYVGNGFTVGYLGGSLETLRQLSDPVISQGRSFDSCGAWLNSVWQDGGLVRGWYHAETNCSYPATDKSVAYAESSDGGRTFTKPGYPNNQVITAPAGYSDDDDDEGDHRIIRVGNYLYLYFVASRDWQVRLARSSVSDGGKPGTWHKYYNGSFSEPGIGGGSTPIDPNGRLTRSWVSYSSYLGGFVGFSYEQRDYSSHPQKFAGMGLTLSQNGVTPWQSLPYLILPSEGEYWGRGASSLELVEYPSLIGLYGDNEQIGQTFWLYYMALNAGEDFDKRYLVRRKVTMERTSLTNPVDIVPRVALSQYVSGDDSWFTTKHVTSGYAYANTIGYLFTDEIANTVPVYDCYIPFWNDHMLVSGDASCGGGEVVRKGRVGWISSIPFAGSLPVYRCFDNEKTNHFISASSNCDGKTYEYQLGYLAREAVPENSFAALSRYENSQLTDTRATTSLPAAEYTFRDRFGYLLVSEQTDTLPVYDCYLPNEQDHMLDILPTCGGAVNQNMGLIGWIKTEEFHGSKRIYRCFQPNPYNHFVSSDANCEGAVTEWPIGYLSVDPFPILQNYIFLPSIRK